MSVCVGKFCGITLMQADMQSILRTEYIVEVTKSLKKRFPLEHAGIIADFNTILHVSLSRC